MCEAGCAGIAALSSDSPPGLPPHPSAVPPVMYTGTGPPHPTDGEPPPHTGPNSRWYSGAGIYRNVWQMTVPDVHVASDGIYLTSRKTEEGFVLGIETELVDVHRIPAGKAGAVLQPASVRGQYHPVIHFGLLKPAVQSVLPDLHCPAVRTVKYACAGGHGTGGRTGIFGGGGSL